ncbi:MAG: hypothetical protein M0015_03580 [Betaproteobacteria bacterium]|nr:hypothetical protein [Betaproteobacteria bacterium]
MSLDAYAAAITQFTHAVAENVTAFVAAMAAVGVLSMAIIQTLKDMLPLRNWYQRAYLRAWLARKQRAAGGGPDPIAAERDLVRLATAGDDKAFYDIPIEQMCGQIGAAMQVVLDYPARRADLLRLMAALAEREDVESLIAATPPAPGGKRAQEEVDARARVMHHVQRAIDALQIAAGYRWKLYLQIASFALSFLVTVIGVAMQPGGLEAVQLPGIALVGIVGGFLAPVARDLLAALQKLR